MPGAIDLHQLSLALDRAETTLCTAAAAIDRATAAELRVRIARARAELDLLGALANARGTANLSPFWMQLPEPGGPTGDPAA